MSAAMSVTSCFPAYASNTVNSVTGSLKVHFSLDAKGDSATTNKKTGYLLWADGHSEIIELPYNDISFIESERFNFNGVDAERTIDPFVVDINGEEKTTYTFFSPMLQIDVGVHDAITDGSELWMTKAAIDGEDRIGPLRYIYSGGCITGANMCSSPLSQVVFANNGDYNYNFDEMGQQDYYLVMRPKSNYKVGFYINEAFGIVDNGNGTYSRIQKRPAIIRDLNYRDFYADSSNNFTITPPTVEVEGYEFVKWAIKNQFDQIYDEDTELWDTLNEGEFDASDFPYESNSVTEETKNMYPDLYPGDKLNLPETTGYVESGVAYVPVFRSTSNTTNPNNPSNPDEPSDPGTPAVSNDVGDPYSGIHDNDGSNVAEGSVSSGNARYVFDAEKSSSLVLAKKVDISARLKALEKSSGYDASAKHRYTVDNKNVAKISKKGVLTPKNRGEVKIYLEQKVKGGSWTKIGEPICMYIQKPEMKKEVSASVGEEISAYSFLGKTTYSPTAWKSSKTSVATVDEKGNIKVLAKGTVKIIAVYGEGKNSSKNKYVTKIKVK